MPTTQSIALTILRVVISIALTGYQPAFHILVRPKCNPRSVKMNTCVLSITDEGSSLAQIIATSLDNCTVLAGGGKVAERLREAWRKYDGIICIMAAGIVVRSIAPLVEDKLSDPCVVVLDQEGTHVISLLSGHIGGGNELASTIARITGGTPVITTASDILGRTALDLWARRNDLVILDRKILTVLSGRQVNGHKPTVYSSCILGKLPADFRSCRSPEGADIVISYMKEMTGGKLYCIPEILYLGVGCNRGTPADEIEESFRELCDTYSLLPHAFKGIGSINVKKDEQGIRQFASKNSLHEHFYTREELNSVRNVSYSQAAMRAVGAQGVAEPAAMLAASETKDEARLIVPKIKWKNVTLAVAERKKSSWE